MTPDRAGAGENWHEFRLQLRPENNADSHGNGAAPSPEHYSWRIDFVDSSGQIVSLDSICHVYRISS